MNGFEVCEHECDQCLFGPNRIVSASRMRQLLKTTSRDDTYFECHKATIAGRHVACRGWYERFSCNFSRIAQRLGMVRFVNPETGRPSSTTDGLGPSPDSPPSPSTKGSYMQGESTSRSPEATGTVAGSGGGRR